MARKQYCRTPRNRIIMMRQKGRGPFFQNTGSSCIKSVGNYRAPGMPGAGPRAISGVVANPTEIIINFSQCVSISSAIGIEFQVDGGGWAQVSSPVEVTGTQWQFTVAPAIDPGDEVAWRYLGGTDSIVDCDAGEDIEEQGPVRLNNPLQLAGDFILLETGGTDILLLEDDIDASSGIITEDAA